MPAKKLTDAEINALIPKLRGWKIVKGKLHIDLTTHSVKGISDYDFVLAEKIDDIFVPVPAAPVGT